MLSCKSEAKANGQTKYFTGKPCRRGHVVYRYVSNGRCSACAADDQRNDAEASKRKARNYLEKHRAEVNLKKELARRAAGKPKRKIGKTLVTVSCDNCGKLFDRVPNQLKFNGKFCSRSCATMVNRPKKLDDFSPFRKFIRSAKNRNKGFCITEQYLKSVWDSQRGTCPISGVSLSLRLYKDSGEANPNQASIDRIDSSLGYVEGNVRFVSLIANVARSNWSDADLIDFCKAVASRHP